MFNYKLYTQYQYSDPVKQILCGRDIDEGCVNTWLLADRSNIYSWRLLNETGMIRAATAIFEAISDTSKKMLVVVDCDVDGYTSAAIFINYLYKLYPDYVLNNLEYFLHSGKQHGLADVPVQDNISCLICPDSSSNDYEQHKAWKEKGTTVIILDHHEAPLVSEDAIVINNQLWPGYPNQHLSGAGVVWQFCRACDHCFKVNYADDFLDLAALGNLSDMMDYRSLETRSIVDNGLKNIENAFFREMVKMNEYSINKMGGVNYFSMAFYVTPYINATIRSGTFEEKEFVFKAFLTQFEEVLVENKKRGHKGEMITLPEEAAHTTSTVKARQTKLQDSTMDFLRKKIKAEHLNENPVIALFCQPGEIEANIAGLVANKIQAEYQRPTLVLTKTYNSDDKEYYYKGSARNYSMSEKQNFRELSEGTDKVEYAQGHEGAFGISIKETDVPDFLNILYGLYNDVDIEPMYYVDYIWDKWTVDYNTVLELSDMQDFWGTGIPETYVCIKDIPLSELSLSLLGVDKGRPTIKMSFQNGVDVMKFKSSQEEYDSLLGENKYITAICKPQKNEWNEIITPQLIIEDYYIKEKWVF